MHQLNHMERLEDTHYSSERRQTGLLRLSRHVLFEMIMHGADAGEYSRADAVARVAALVELTQPVEDL